MHFTPRPYQSAAVSALTASLANGKHPIVKLPTGSGKSLVLAMLIAHLYEQRRPPIVVLSHVKELLEQDSKALRLVDPNIPQGFYCAGLGEKRPGAPVVFGSVQTASRALDALRSRSYIFIDEAHLCPRDADAMYARTFAHFSLAQRAGFTATDQRLDSGKLTEGPDAWFDCIAYEEPVEALIKQGYLVPLVGVMTEHQADLAGVGSRGGEFIIEQAEAAVVNTIPLNAAVQEAIKLARRRKHWLVFAAGVDHARKIVAELRSAGIDADLVTGETPAGERDDLVDKFRAGDLKALVNVGVLTTGFDAPMTDCIISLRPTKSPVLWQQMMGRGMRIALNKTNCLLLDFVGNLERLGGAGCVVEIDDHRDPMKRKQQKEPQSKRPRDEPTYTSASLSDPMKSGQSFECRVERARYFAAFSHKANRRMGIAEYDLLDDLGRAVQARQFICVEHSGYARFQAELWYQRRGVTSQQVPRTADAAVALARVLPQPIEVRAYWDPRLKCYLIMEERFASS